MSVRKRIEYKLHYFDGRGRAEIARVILAYANIPYDDIRYSHEEWPQHKSRMPFGQLPVLEWRGQLLPQSNVINRFLAHRHGLGGENEWQAAQIDAYVALMTDALEESRPVYMARNDEAKMKEALEHFITTALEPAMDRLEKALADNDTGFLVGNKLSLADIMLFACSDLLKTWGVSDRLTKWEHVTKLINHVQGIPSIKEWLNKRPVTAF